MFKRSILLLLTVSALVGVARTLLVGHRGCNIGVENTSEAFKNGAARGYDYLECDVRVTADSVFVISHDTDNKRLGGHLEIASATLSELRGDTLRQTRNGVEYIGYICTLGEYLDICRDAGIKPVIELKWSTGINSNDFSNIPALLDFITKAGFDDKCIILTSMKPCLEYIRKIRPDIKLQFLGSKKWRESFDWCDSLRMDVDIAHDCLSKEAVDSLHKAGLTVNCWTVDNLDRARELQQMGVDIITTNALTHPEVNPD